MLSNCRSSHRWGDSQKKVVKQGVTKRVLRCYSKDTFSMVNRPSINTLDEVRMSTPVTGQKSSVESQSARESVPRRLIVTASVVIFAIRDWSYGCYCVMAPGGRPCGLSWAT